MSWRRDLVTPKHKGASLARIGGNRGDSIQVRRLRYEVTATSDSLPDMKNEIAMGSRGSPRCLAESMQSCR